MPRDPAPRDPAMAQLDTLLEHLWCTEIQRHRVAYVEELDEDPGEAASALAQERYEASVIDEARGIVAGEIEQAPTVEHLRIALAWMDGASPAPLEKDGDRPF